MKNKTEKDQELKRKYKKTLDEKAQHQEKIRFFESNTLTKQNSKHQLEEQINNKKIEKAQFAAQKEAAEQEKAEFKGAKIMRLTVEDLKARLIKTENILATIGSVNMRSLEVYDGVKKEYDKVQEKADTLVKEKEEIIKIIEDIDKKKRKVFLKTLEEINKLFTRNFNQLSTKGEATLVPTNKEDLFEGGIEMLIKVGKGKYFDTHSLSGGEKSLVSLSLIFAIQEYKPYCFYIFDEIDAALDRRNSERLAALLRKYMKNGQYIIITHNDSLITESPTIYGVSMQDKISSVLSLEV
jgi:chromosome segregation protein